MSALVAAAPGNYVGDRGVDHTKGGFLRMLNDTNHINIYKQVMDYLTDVPDWKFYWAPSDVFPRYDYVKLRATPISSLYKSFNRSMIAEDDYVYDPLRSAGCQCDKPDNLSQAHDCRRLKSSLDIPIFLQPESAVYYCCQVHPRR